VPSFWLARNSGAKNSLTACSDGTPSKPYTAWSLFVMSTNDCTPSLVTPSFEVTSIEPRKLSGRFTMKSSSSQTRSVIDVPGPIGYSRVSAEEALPAAKKSTVAVAELLVFVFWIETSEHWFW
jgi:hypothetical protein